MEDKLYNLVDRLQKCSEIKYPNRKWNNEFYYECAWQWRDKLQELEKRVLQLEKELNINPTE